MRRIRPTPGDRHLNATISVVIPTYNEEVSLPPTLGQFERLAGSWQVIVADSGSRDRTIEIARESGVMVVEDAPAGRGAAMNAGAGVATGDVLLFLHADSRLPDTAYDLITGALSDPGVAATGFRLRMDRDGWRYKMLSPIATLRFCIQRTFFGDQAIAVRRSDFEQVGGYHEPLLMEDVELSRRLRRRGRLELLPAQVTTSARRFERGGVFRTLLLMSGFQVAYSLGISAERLHSWYRNVRSASDSGPVERIDLGTLELLDETDHPVRLVEDGQHGPTLLVFLRWLG